MSICETADMDDRHQDAPPAEATRRVVGESRWPMATAVVVLVLLTVLLPRSLIVRPRWPVPLAEGLLLLAVIIGDPGKIDRRSRVEHALTIGLVTVLAVNALGHCTAHRRTHPRRDRREFGQLAIGGRRDGLGLQLHRLRTALLGSRQR